VACVGVALALAAVAANFGMRGARCMRGGKGRAVGAAGKCKPTGFADNVAGEECCARFSSNIVLAIRGGVLQGGADGEGGVANVVNVNVEAAQKGLVSGGERRRGESGAEQTEPGKSEAGANNATVATEALPITALILYLAIEVEAAENGAESLVFLRCCALGGGATRRRGEGDAHMREAHIARRGRGSSAEKSRRERGAVLRRRCSGGCCLRGVDSESGGCSCGGIVVDGEF
jgi:hypothetical protein